MNCLRGEAKPSSGAVPRTGFTEWIDLNLGQAEPGGWGGASTGALVYSTIVFNLDPAKLLVILVLILVVLGPERLPRVARQLGGAWREVTRVRDQVTTEVRNAMPDLGELDPSRFTRPTRSISSILFDAPATSSTTAADNVDATDQADSNVDAATAHIWSAANDDGTTHSPDVNRESAPFLPDDPAMN